MGHRALRIVCGVCHVSRIAHMGLFRRSVSLRNHREKEVLP